MGWLAFFQLHPLEVDDPGPVFTMSVNHIQISNPEFQLNLPSLPKILAPKPSTPAKLLLFEI